MAAYNQSKESVRSQVTGRYVSKGLPIFIGVLSALPYVCWLLIVTLVTPDSVVGRLVLAALSAAAVVIMWQVAKTKPGRRRLALTATVAALMAACLAHEVLPFWDVWRWTALGWLFVSGAWVITIISEESTRDPRTAGMKALTADGNPLQAVFTLAAQETKSDPLRVTTTRTAPAKIEGLINLEPGQDAESFLSSGGLADVESGANLPPGSLNGKPSRTSRREVHVSLSDPTALDVPPMWPGPSRPGASIADPIHLGMFQTMDVCEVVAISGNVSITGMTGAGKDFGGAWNFLGEVITRDDVAVLACDPAKDRQTLGPLEAALHVVEYSADGGRAMLADIDAEIPRRTAWLAERKFASWRPGCGLKYWIVFLTEFPRLVQDMDDEEWEQFKTTLKEIRSAGGRFVVSLQDFHHSEVEDIGVVRGQFGCRWTFGMMSLSAAKRSLTDRQLNHDYAPGTAPHHWGDSVPGRSLIDFKSLSGELVTTPLHTWNWGLDDAERYKAMERHVAAHTHTHDHEDDEFTARVVAKAAARAARRPAAASADPIAPASTTAADDVAPDAPVRRGSHALRAAGSDVEPGDEAIDTRQPITSSADTGIEFPAPPDPEPTVTPEQAQRLLFDTICSWADDGRERFATADVREVWTAVGYTRQWAQKHLLRLHDDGVLERRGQEWVIVAGGLERARDREFVGA